jgi:hypothetical protein
MYDADGLQAFYEEYLLYLDEVQIKWIRCSYLRGLAAARTTMVRCQEVPASEVILGGSWLPLSREEPRGRFVVSHPWLSRWHPDPGGQKLQTLVQQLDLLGASDDDAVYIDFMSLPQHDLQDPDLQRLMLENNIPKPGEHPSVRTEAEDVMFRKALGSLELLFSTGSNPIIVLPMDDLVEPGTEYVKRCWCLLEICLGLSFGNISNEAHDPVGRMCKRLRELEADTPDGFSKALEDCFDQSIQSNADTFQVINQMFVQVVSKFRHRM